mmetsp:Transcript_41376/g.81055  ORF Transcript_41376/g.81055 Transcript_41376/m.81055 type:complete len:377 (-) Transcript_41376:464-1594(-)
MLLSGDGRDNRRDARLRPRTRRRRVLGPLRHPPREDRLLLPADRRHVRRIVVVPPPQVEVVRPPCHPEEVHPACACVGPAVVCREPRPAPRIECAHAEDDVRGGPRDLIAAVCLCQQLHVGDDPVQFPAPVREHSALLRVVERADPPSLPSVGGEGVERLRAGLVPPAPLPGPVSRDVARSLRECGPAGAVRGVPLGEGVGGRRPLQEGPGRVRQERADAGHGPRRPGADGVRIVQLGQSLESVQKGGRAAGEEGGGVAVAERAHEDLVVGVLEGVRRVPDGRQAPGESIVLRPDNLRKRILRHVMGRPRVPVVVPQLGGGRQRSLHGLRMRRPQVRREGAPVRPPERIGGARLRGVPPSHVVQQLHVIPQDLAGG